MNTVHELPSFPFGSSLEIQHRSLHAMMSWLESELERQERLGAEHDGPILGPLRSLARSLASHFEDEERTGFAAARDQGLGDRVDGLEAQHRDLLQRVQGLIDGYEHAAQPGVELDPELPRSLRGLFADLRAHDRAEHEVLHLVHREPSQEGA